MKHLPRGINSQGGHQQGPTANLTQVWWAHLSIFAKSQLQNDFRREKVGVLWGTGLGGGVGVIWVGGGGGSHLISGSGNGKLPCTFHSNRVTTWEHTQHECDESTVQERGTNCKIVIKAQYKCDEQPLKTSQLTHKNKTGPWCWSSMTDSGKGII